MAELGLKHMRLARASGVPFGPKNHLFTHMLKSTGYHGNPRSYHTFMDETLNRTLANVAKAAYASVWEFRMFGYFCTLGPEKRGAGSYT